MKFPAFFNAPNIFAETFYGKRSIYFRDPSELTLAVRFIHCSSNDRCNKEAYNDK